MLTVKILFRHVCFFFWVHTAETRSTWHTEKWLAPSLLPPAVEWKHGVLVGGVSVRFLKSRVSDESWMILFYSWMSAAFLSVGSGLVSVLFLTTPSVVCVCVCARWGAKKGGGGGAFRARKPTATFMTARVASGVSHIKKSKAKKQQRSKLYTVVVTAVWVLRMEKGYER